MKITFDKWTNTIHGSKYFNFYIDGSFIETVRYSDHRTNGEDLDFIIRSIGKNDSEQYVKIGDDLYYEKECFSVFSEKMKNQKTVTAALLKSVDFLNDIEEMRGIK